MKLLVLYLVVCWTLLGNPAKASNPNVKVDSGDAADSEFRMELAKRNATDRRRQGKPLPGCPDSDESQEVSSMCNNIVQTGQCSTYKDTYKYLNCQKACNGLPTCFGDKCYTLVSEKMTVEDATKYCMDKGQSLVAIRSGEDNNFLAELVKCEGVNGPGGMPMEFWTSGKRVAHSLWKWTKEEGAWKANGNQHEDGIWRNWWGRDRPSGHLNPNWNCILFVNEWGNGQMAPWFKADCNHRAKFICEGPKAQPMDCQLGSWSNYGSCSATCGGGRQSRTRPIIRREQNGGRACGETTESRECNTQSCHPFYSPFGPQVNVPTSKITEGGWTQCHSRRYNQPLSEADFYRLRDTHCNSAYVMVGCRQTKSDTMSLIAWAGHSFIFGRSGNKCKFHETAHGQVSEGTQWYMYTKEGYKGRYGAFGFAGESSSLKLECLDYGKSSPEKRLTWMWDYVDPKVIEPHGGYRCGAATKLSNSPDWELVMFTSN